MQKFILTTLLLTLIHVFNFTPVEAKTKDAWRIKLKINGIKNDTCILAYHFGNRILVQDTFLINSKGVCEMHAENSLPGGIYVAVIKKTLFFEFLVSGNEPNFTIETDTSDFIGKMKVQNSKENKLFNNYQLFLKKIGDEVEILKTALSKAENHSDSSAINEKLTAKTEEINEFRIKEAQAHKGSFYAQLLTAMAEPAYKNTDNNATPDPLQTRYFIRNHFWDSFDFADPRLARTPIFYNKLKTYFERLTMQIPDSLIQACDEVVPRTKPNRELFQFTVGYLAQFYESSKIMGMESVFVHLADKYFLTGEATWLTEANLKKIRERVMRLKPNLIGKLAPELLLTDSAGTKVSIRKINADYTILYFWSYDCGHCKKETPHYLDLYHKYKNKDVKFVGISTKLERDKWLNYIKEHQLDWYNLYDPTGQTRMHELYDIYSTPTIFLLDKDKKIIAKRINYGQIDMILDDLINKKQGKAIELKDEN